MTSESLTRQDLWIFSCIFATFLCMGLVSCSSQFHSDIWGSGWLGVLLLGTPLATLLCTILATLAAITAWTPCAQVTWILFAFGMNIPHFVLFAVFSISVEWTTDGYRDYENERFTVYYFYLWILSMAIQFHLLGALFFMNIWTEGSVDADD